MFPSPSSGQVISVLTILRASLRRCRCGVSALVESIEHSDRWLVFTSYLFVSRALAVADLHPLPLTDSAWASKIKLVPGLHWVMLVGSC